jgi:hypothetical protein
MLPSQACDTSCFCAGQCILIRINTHTIEKEVRECTELDVHVRIVNNRITPTSGGSLQHGNDPLGRLGMTSTGAV